VSKARAQAKMTVCQSNVRQLFVGILNYCNDNHDWYPTCSAPADGAAYMQYADDWVYWQPARIVPAGATIDDSPIGRYLNVRGAALKALLRCPADSFDGRKPKVGTPFGQGPYLYTYALNAGVGLNTTPSFPATRTKRQQWHRQNERILLTETLYQPPKWFAGAGWEAGALPRYHGAAMSKQTRTMMAINVSAAFMDGHVGTIDDDFAQNLWQVNAQ
jgi:hypothetical protein